MTDAATCAARDGIGVLTLDNPPVNALGVAARRALQQGLRRFVADDAIKAIVLIGEGRTFSAGADITEFGKPSETPTLATLFEAVESAPKPVVAAIHGAALGGGFELALACHCRVAVPSATVGLPEVKLGLLPGAGGTQRVTRIAGVETALDMITSGRSIGAHEALRIGLIDALAKEGSLRDDAVAFAKTLVAAGTMPTCARDRQDLIEAARGKPEIFTDFRRKNARGFRGLEAPESAIRAIEAAVDLPFDEGLAYESQLFEQLEASVQSAALRHVFFGERDTSKIPDVPSSTPVIPVETVGVIGAGTMGGGIAMAFLNAGLPVVLVETNREALDRGIAAIRRIYENLASKGRIAVDQVDKRIGLITPAIGLEALSAVDLVVEAVFEEMGVKQDIFRKLDTIVKTGAILASNTSYLDIDQIAAATSRPEHVIGLHFFSPAHVMRLLEIVRGTHSSNEVIATGIRLAKRIGKVPVLSRVCPGFIANRIMAKRGDQADALILEGPAPAEIDRVLRDYGFAMGHFQMMDMVGLDVLGRALTERSVIGDLFAIDRFGQKKNGGYYDYDDSRNPTPSPVAAQVIAQFAQFKGIERRDSESDEDILGRLLYPVVNEAAKLIEEGIALRASDIDIAAILGYGWPPYTGGPMFWADTVGLPVIVDKLKAYQAIHGDAFAPSALLERLAAEGKGFTRD